MPVLMPDAIVIPSGSIADLSGAQIDWNGLTLFGSYGGGPCRFSRIDGWEDPPEVRSNGADRPNAHGQFDEPGYTSGRSVIVAGACGTSADRDALLWQMQAAMVPGLLSDLTVTLAGRTLFARARLRRFGPEIAETWAAGHFPWLAQWSCPDPHRYGSPVTVSTGLPSQAGGLDFPLFADGFLDFGEAGTSGRVTATNPGTAEAHSLFTVSGTLPSGFELIEVGGGRRLRYEGPITAAGDSLTLDSATGRVRLGTADRGGSLTRGEWWPVPAGGSVEVLFTSLGGYSADASLSVTTTPTFW